MSNFVRRRIPRPVKNRLSSLKQTVLASVRYHRTHRILGRTYRIPVVFQHGLENLRPYEPFMDCILAAAAKSSSGVFVDVGANLGQILLKMSSLNPARPYIGFDPSTFNASYVQQLIDINGLDQCTIFPVGLSARFSTVKFLFSGEGDPMGTIVPGFWSGATERTRSVAAVALAGDDILATLGIGKVGIIKIDVEGGELDVIEGLRETIGLHRPIVIVEVLPMDEENSTLEALKSVPWKKARAAKLHDILKDAGYMIYRILGYGEHSEVSEFFMGRYTDGEHNYVAVPASVADAYFGHLGL